MHLIFTLLLLAPLSSQAAFIFNYGLNYSSQVESSDAEFTNSRTFHDILLGASVNGQNTVFFGWNINSWSATSKSGEAEEDTYSLLEMGPKIIWYLNDSQNWYISGEWNPYAKGTRSKGGQESDITGSSMAFGFGYRFKLSKLVGLGAGIHYHTLSLEEEKIDTTATTATDTVTNLMPMLELSIITK